MKTVFTSRPRYKRDSKGKTRTWLYEVGNDGDKWGWRTTAGLEDGKKVTSGWTEVGAKNVGRSNEMTPEAQAYAEGLAEDEKKLARGYFADEDNIDTFDKFKPMLAHNYEDYPIEWGKEKVFSQPKLDGIRCIARSDGLWTRTGKQITSCDHIWQAMLPLFAKFPKAVFDGELYNHELRDDFNQITSLVRRQFVSEEEAAQCKEMIQYHIYDMLEDPKMSRLFEHRYGDLESEFDLIWQHEITEAEDNTPLRLVEAVCVGDQAHLDQLNGEYLEAGYEGQMVRLNVTYQNKRTKYLLKRKEFITEEFKVGGILEGNGNWKGCVKHLIVQEVGGKVFKSGIRGSKEKLRAMWKAQQVPDWATIRYFQRTPDGVPRFPIAVDWGIGQRDD